LIRKALNNQQVRPPVADAIAAPVTLTFDLLTSELICQQLLTWVTSHVSLNVVWFSVFTARREICPSVLHTPAFCQHRWTYPQFFYHQIALTQFSRSRQLTVGTGQTDRQTDWLTDGQGVTRNCGLLWDRRINNETSASNVGYSYYGTLPYDVPCTRKCNFFRLSVRFVMFVPNWTAESRRKVFLV